MKHLLKKLSIAGGGGSKKPKPPIYKPPVMGELQYGASFSYAETLDLVSDGPIEGLVNANGETVDGLKMLQGIYLDDTPVAITTDSPRELNELTTLETETIETLNMQLDSTEGVTFCSEFFQELKEATQRSSDGRITALNSSTAGGIDNEEGSSSVDVGMVFLRETLNPNVRSGTAGRSAVATPLDPLIPAGLSDYAIYIRGYMKFRGAAGAQVFPWFLNGELQTGYNDSNAAFRDDSRAKGTLDNLLWSNASDLNVAKFIFSFQPNLSFTVRLDGFGDGNEEGKIFDQNEEIINDNILAELNTIYDLYINNNQEEGNVFQRDLALRALNRLGYNDGNVTSLIKNYLNPEEYGGVIIVKTESSNSNLNKTIVDGTEMFDMSTLPFGTQNSFNLKAVMQNAGMRVTDVTCPEINTDGTLTGVMHGFVIFEFPIENDSVETSVLTNRGNEWVYGNANTYKVPREVINALSDLNSFKYSKVIAADEEMPTQEVVESEVLTNDFQTTNLKYNYSNVLAELKKGTETQDPFRFFSKVFIDHVYDRELFGPFGVAKADGNPNTVGDQRNSPQRIMTNAAMLTRSSVVDIGATNYNTALEGGLPLDEGSDDQRKDAEDKSRNYSDWGENSLATFDERALPVVHTIYNPNVEEVFVTLDITELKDTLVRDVNDVRSGRGEENKNLKVGTTFPSVLNIQIETGKIGKKSDGSEGQIPFRTYTYRIVALIEGNTLIDIGNPDYQTTSGREFLVELNGADDDLNYLSQPFRLPITTTQKQQVLSSDGEEGVEAGTLEEDSTQKRYVKITKLSYESNSVLLAKVVSVRKVTEIIDVDLPYPFSAIVGTKLDSRAFGSIPRRSFDCKLKKVKTPSNYFPTKNGIDKRYYANQKLFDDTSKENKLVYKGDWDGSFHDELMWTDNPAWILYDLLTSSRYGMGSHIDIDTINKFQLYKIGRFCDAVDDEGFFEGVSDGRGGKEPRFSCNIVFDQGQKIFDAINTIASLFKGRTFFSNSEINFVDDRPRETVNLFTNESVKDGLFFYSNNRRDEQFNCIEVGYRDRFDNFSPKIEVVEDEEDIKERGIFKKKIEGIGITSRAMARRMAQHQIFSKIKENQQVAFTAGLESLLCKPGDLVIIEDELKTNKANFGKVLSVDAGNQIIRLSNEFNTTMSTGLLSVYNPTGADSSEDLSLIANSIRQRYYGFTVTGLGTASYVRYTGDYGFSGYTQGYAEATGKDDERFQEYALYTGLSESGTYLYFETGVTGWIFGSGDDRSLFGGDLISLSTGTQTLADLNIGNLAAIDMAADDKRAGTSALFSGITSLNNYTRGITTSEINGMSPDQISVLSVTGIVSNESYGSLVSGFDKPEVLPFVKLGSPAKYEIKDASPFIYKVLTMKEEAPNEYLVTASKYDTGKFNLIDKNISIEEKANTFSYQVAQTINGITYKTLDPPVLSSVTTGVPNLADKTFSITGAWSAVTNSTGYNMTLNLPNGQSINESTTATNGGFDSLGQVGVFNFSVNALGNNGGAGVDAYFDSDYASSGIFVVYEESLTFSKSFLDRITIL